MLYTSTLRMVEGLGTSMFSTATFALLPHLFPKSISTAMVQQTGGGGGGSGEFGGGGSGGFGGGGGGQNSP